MRRRIWTKAVAAVAFGIVAVLLSAGPASAADPLPPPVDPLPGMPSTYQKVIATGSGQIFEDQIKFNLWMRQQMAAARAAAATTPVAGAAKVATGVPITAAAPFARGAAGSVLTGAFMAGWMITDGTLALYASATGTNPLGGTCDWADFGVAAVEILYPFSSPNCKPTYAAPNDGVSAGPSTIEYGGWSAVYKGHTNGSSGTYYYFQTGALGSGYQIGYPKLNGGMFWGGTSLSSTSNQTAINLGANSFVSTSVGATGSSISGLAATSNVLSVRATATGTVVATAILYSGNPGRIPRCDIEWPDGSTTSQTGLAYQEGSGIPMSQFDSLCNDAYVSQPGRGPALLPSEIRIGSTNEETGEYTEIQKQTVPEFTPDEGKGLTPGTTGGGLVLQRVIGTLVGNCLKWEVSCASWWPATENGTDPVTADGYYRCLFNGSPVPLTECSPYQTTFDTQTSTPTITDPSTGEQSPWTSGTPQPGTSTGTGTFPSTGANPAPAASAATGGGGCTAGWSWNPVDWVLNPIRCAFIPSTASVTGTLDALGESAGNVAAVDPLMALLDTLPASGGCAGIPIELTFFGKTATGHLLGACDGYGATAAAVVNGLLTLSIATGAIIAVTRYAAAVFGFVGPGGGIQQQEYSNHMMARSAARSD